MIIVTGTKRSGTSMWMQVLKAAGVPVLGQAFPKHWETRLRPLNPNGFYESRFRHGINFTNNPDPETGAYLAPRECREMAVKIFVPGLVRTEVAFLDRVIGTVRAWRSYAASRKRLEAFDLAGAPEERFALAYPMPAPLEWWYENYGLIRDATVRGYPIHMVTYEEVVADPSPTVGPVLEGLGLSAEAVRSGIEAVGRTSDAHSWQLQGDAGLDAETIATFDDLYAAIADGARFSPALIDRLDETNARLRPRIVEITQDNHLQRAAAWGRRHAEETA